jgi:hypothetical protein
MLKVRRLFDELITVLSLVDAGNPRTCGVPAFPGILIL